MSKDIIFDFINAEKQRQEQGLEMIASENFTYPEVMQAAGSILTNKYAEGYAHKRYYGGCEEVDKVEELAQKRCCELFGCDFANVQPHSGSQANAAVYLALLSPGDRILGMDLSQGGHLTHGAKVSSSGKYYESHFYGVNSDGFIDYDEVEKIALEIKPKLIVCGASAYSRTIDFARFRQIADKCQAYLMADIAHIAGLVAANLHPSSIPHAHVTTSTTHKTLRGTRGGIIMTNDEALFKKINSAVFPGLQGGPLMHIIAAKAIGFAKNLEPAWRDYAKLVISNAKVLADELIKHGFKVVSNGTENHLVLMDLKEESYSGKDAEIKLGQADITANKNTVPNETRSPFVTSGLRLGTAALSARGMGEAEMKMIAAFIKELLQNENPDVKAIKAKVHALAAKFPIQ